MSSVLKYEWLRFVTMRSTYVFLGIIVAVTAGFGWLIGWVMGNIGSDMPRPTVAGRIPFSELLQSPVLVIVAIFLGVLAAQAIGQEYRTGMIRVTLVQFPHRSRVLAGKCLMMAVVTVVVAIAAIALFWLFADLGAGINGASVSIDWATGWGSTGGSGLMLRAVIYVLIFAGIMFTITLLTRNMPVGIVIPIVFALVVENLIRLVLFFAVQPQSENELNDFWVMRILPFASGTRGLALESGAWMGTITFAVWLLVILVPGWILFARRDA